MTVDDIPAEIGIAAAYGGVGLLLMVLGFLLVDMLTPGNLREQIWRHRNRNATVLLASNLLAVGIIGIIAIRASADALLPGLISAAAFGVLGLLLMAVSFVLLDAATPGKLGELMVSTEPHPAVWVSAASHLAIAGIIAAAIY